MKKYVPIGAALALAFVVSGCITTAEQRCRFYEAAHARAIANANGNVAKINIANIAYAPLKVGCAAQGIVIN